jgi:transposase
MHIATIPNRSSPPCVLVGESFREGRKVRKRTLANVTNLPPKAIEALRIVFKGGTAIDSLEGAFEKVGTHPHGHVAAVLGTLNQLGLDRIISAETCSERQLVVAMIVARILKPDSKLATARGLGQDSFLASLTAAQGLKNVNEEKLYRAMDWLYPRQAAIENELARRHLEDGSLVLYDLTSTYFEGHTCPLAQLGYPRDGKKGKLQIVFGLLCNREGCPVAVEVFGGNTADPKTFKPQLDKVRDRFGLQRVVFVGDRGMLTSATIDEHLRGQDGIDWISALRSTEIRTLLAQPGFQYSLFDQRGFVEIEHPDFPQERLIVCRNPLQAQRRKRKREALLQATEEQLKAVAKATQRPKRPLRGKENIALRVGRILNRFNVAKHFILKIEDDHFSYLRNQELIAKEAGLDGFYVIRTSVPEKQLSAEETVRAYKGLSVVERAFRSFKTVDLHVRPIGHTLPERVRTHVFMCMLAYYVEWHMRQKLAPLLFDDEAPEAGEALRKSVVAPAQRSPSAIEKARTKRTADGFPVHSFQTLLEELANVTRDLIQPKIPGVEPFYKLTSPNRLQQNAFDLLGVTL